MPKNISDTLRNPTIKADLIYMQTPTWFAEGYVKGIGIDGQYYSELQYGPWLYDSVDTVYTIKGPVSTVRREAFKYPPNAAGSDIWRLHDAVPHEIVKFGSAYGSVLDWCWAGLKTELIHDHLDSHAWDIQRIRHDNFNKEDYRYTVDRETDYTELIRLLKLAPLAGMAQPDDHRNAQDYDWRVHVIEQLQRLATYYFMGEIQTALFINKWKDLPSLEAANDVLINRILPEAFEGITKPTTYTVKFPSLETNTFYVMDYQGDIKFTRDSDLWGVSDNRQPPLYLYDLKKYNRLRIRDLTQESGFIDSSAIRKEIYMEPLLAEMAIEALEGITTLVLENIKKLLATETAVEEESPYDLPEDYGDAEANPFLIFDRNTSELIGRPMFKDVSTRPGKQEISYADSTIPLSAWLKADEKFLDYYKLPDAAGSLRRKVVEQEKKNNLLALLALGGAGYLAYKQMGG